MRKKRQNRETVNLLEAPLLCKDILPEGKSLSITHFLFYRQLIFWSSARDLAKNIGNFSEIFDITWVFDDEMTHSEKSFRHRAGTLSLEFICQKY